MIMAKIDPSSDPEQPKTSELVEEPGSREQTVNKCACLQTCMAEEYPLSTEAGLWERFTHNFLCPPHSTMGAILFVVVFAMSSWAALYSMTGRGALPGGNLFALFLVFMACYCGGYLAECARLPPLLGMLLVGGVLGNVPGLSFARDVIPAWSSGCRQIALTIILLRAGLGLDPQALMRLSFVVLRLAFMPCLMETFVDGLLARFVLGFPWSWGFMLGFVIAAVSPAVVVPCLLGLSDKGYGLDKGIPTLVIAAASVDDVLAITGFGVMLGISFSSGDIAWTLAKGPIEAVAGIAVGTFGGVLIWYLPQRKSAHLILFRSSLLVCLGLLAIFGSRRLDWAGSGPLAALTLAFVAALRWRTESRDEKQTSVEQVAGVLWLLFQPLLFGLIGAEVDVASLDINTVGLCLAVLSAGLLVRMATSFLAVSWTDLNLREKFFITVAWLPKATVQAAIGAVALDTAKEGGNTEHMKLGKTILNMAVLAILMTAPLGSLLISLLGPVFLTRRSGVVATAVTSKTEEGQGQQEAEGRDDVTDETGATQT